MGKTLFGICSAAFIVAFVVGNHNTDPLAEPKIYGRCVGHSTDRQLDPGAE
jgi:hypothetical protein